MFQRKFAVYNSNYQLLLNNVNSACSCYCSDLVLTILCAIIGRVFYKRGQVRTSRSKFKNCYHTSMHDVEVPENCT